MSDPAPAPFNVCRALEERFSGEGWATFYEVRNGTGFAKSPRSADMLAMNTWPSRGLELHGIEVKASRSDWLKELKDPAKADEGIYKYCDRWWLAVDDPKIVVKSELPKTWGLLAPRGGKLVAVVDAERLSPVPLDRAFVASLVRHASTYKSSDDRVARLIEETKKTAYADGKKRAEEQARWNRDATASALDHLKHDVEKFEHESGCSVQGNYNNTGKRYRRFLEIVEQPEVLERLEHFAQWLDQNAQTLRGSLEALRNLDESAVAMPAPIKETENATEHADSAR